MTRPPQSLEVSCPACRAGSLLVLAALLSVACGPGAIEIDAVLPRESDAQVTSVERLRVSGVSHRGATVEGLAPGLEAVTLPDIEDGRWVFTLTGLDRDGRARLQGRTVEIGVARGAAVRVRVVLAPVERIAPLPASGPEVSELSSRVGPTASTVRGSDGSPAVLVAGGSLDGEPRREAWLYRPDRVAFERVESMHCPRAGHSALTVELPGGRQGVLVAGGGSSRCEGSEPGNAAQLLELFDPETRRFVAFSGGIDPTSDLSEALLAPFSRSEVFLAGRGRAWRLDLRARLQDVARRLETRHHSVVVSGARAAPLGPEVLEAAEGGLMALFGGRTGTVGAGEIVVFDHQQSCGSVARVDMPDGGHTATYVPTGRVLVVHERTFWRIESLGCTGLGSFATGGLGRSHVDHTATRLADGRLLIVGGSGSAGPAATTLFHPAASSPVHHPGPPALHGGHGHAAAALPDGTALIVGDGVEPELFNPYRDAPARTDSFGLGYRPTPDDALRLVFVVETGGAAAGLRLALGLRATAALPLDPRNEMSRMGFGVGVLPATMGPGHFVGGFGCTPDQPPPPWSRCGSGPELLSPSDPTFESGLQCRIRNEEAEELCEIPQPLALVDALVRAPDSGGGPYSETLWTGPGALVVVVVARGDDCSPDPAYQGGTLPFSREICASAEGLLDPEVVARRVRDGAIDDNRVEVVVLHDQNATRPPVRLAAFVDALGDAGALHAVDDATLDAALDAVAERAASLAYRRVCVPGRVAGEGQRECEVFAVRASGNDEVLERLAPGSAWTLEPEGDRCPAEEDLGGWSLLRLAPAYGAMGAEVEGTFSRFHYVCW